MRSISIVIPALAEADYLEKTLASLHSSASASTTRGQNCTVVVVVNNPVQASNEILQNNAKLLKNINHHKDRYCFRLIALDYTNPGLNQGVGEARKLGMDYSVANILQDSKDWIVSLDADATVHTNYVETLSSTNFSGAGFTFPFSHQVAEERFAYPITLYELYLRYIQAMLAKVGSPFAYFTIGSCMGTNVHHYKVSGGMIAKPATEDFHFLNKLRKFGEIKTIAQTCVYPAARPSKRVYLGTGFFLATYLENPEKAWSQLMLPSPLAFKTLKNVLVRLDEFFEDPEATVNQILLYQPYAEFFRKNEVLTKLTALAKNSSTKASFQKRIPQVFDGLMTWRLLRFLSHKEAKTDIPTFLNWCQSIPSIPVNDPIDLLNQFRPSRNSTRQTFQTA